MLLLENYWGCNCSYSTDSYKLLKLKYPNFETNNRDSEVMLMTHKQAMPVVY